MREYDVLLLWCSHPQEAKRNAALQEAILFAQLPIEDAEEQAQVKVVFM